MSERAAPAAADGAPRSAPAAAAAGPGWSVRAARHEDVPGVAGAVSALLVELGGEPGCASAMQETVATLIDSHWEGAVLVAEAEGALVGVLAASWQIAIHVPGAYALIQDLWVEPAWRGRAVGAGLIDALVALARSRRLERVEVGLPKESFAGFAATEAFYLGNGFAANGPRMRRLLP